MMASTLARIEVRMPPPLKTQLQALAKERGVSLSEIGLAAVQEFLERPGRPDSAVLDALQQLGSHTDHLQVVLEAFIRVFFTVSPDLGDPEDPSLDESQRALQRTAARRGHQRWTKFCARIAATKEGH